MTFEELAAIQDETRRISATYDLFNEDTRLTASRAASVEYLTTLKILGDYLRPGMQVLDVGAGTGAYSFALAQQGVEVTAVELADRNVHIFREKLKALSAANPAQPLPKLLQGNALQLDSFEENSFDAVLLFGPLYHLTNPVDRQRCLAQARRVLKPGGILAAAFISNDMVIVTEFSWNSAFFTGDSYDHETFHVKDFPFVFATPPECCALLQNAGFGLLRQVASDGVSELMADRINALDDAGWQQYLCYHFYCCEKPELLGRSNHLLYVARNKAEK